MTRITGSEARGMMEAYNAIYASQEETLEQEIFEEVAYALISQGHTAVDVLEYFANTDNEVIVEDVIGISDGTLLFESVVSEEYVEEQIQQLNEYLGAALRIGQAAVKGAQFAQKTGMLGRAGGALKASGTAATRVAQQGAKASSVVRPAIGRAVQGARSAIGGAVSKVKDVARGALSKLPGGASGKLARAGKFLGKAAGGGAAFEAGMRGVGALMGGGKGPDAAKTAPSGDKAKYNASKALGGKTAFAAGGGAAAMKKDPKLTAADIQKRGNEALFKAGGGKAAMGGKTRAQVMAQGSKNVAEKPTATPPSRPAAVTPAATKVAPTKAVTPTPGTKAAGPESIRPKTPNPLLKGGEISAMIKRSQERQAVTPKPTPLAPRQTARERVLNQSYEYDAYDLVLEYLLSNGHVETVDEAHYVMLEMEAEVIQNIVEETKRTEYLQKKFNKENKRKSGSAHTAIPGKQNTGQALQKARESERHMRGDK